MAGLTTAEALLQLKASGPNRAAEHDAETFLEELLETFKEPLVLLLLLVCGLYFIFGEIRDALIVLGVIVTVSVTEATIEWRAARAISALRDMADPRARVWRDGRLTEIPVEQIVPGDLLELRAGVRIAADARLVAGYNLAADESLVTGESVPVEHNAGDNADVGLLGGTMVVRGTGQAVVTRTGGASTLGQIASLVASAKEPKTPMQRQMAELARTLLWVALTVSVLIPAFGVLAGQPPKEMLLTGLALAFATIPEELAVLIVIVLGLGSLALAKRGAIVRQIRAAETLGAVTIICTDKTGTLTLNKMTLTRSLPAARLLGGVKADDGTLMRAAALASEPDNNTNAIDPVDSAIHAATGDVVGIRHFGFDQVHRLAAGYVEDGDNVDVGVKGAPEAVLDRCTTYRLAVGVEPITPNILADLQRLASEAGRRGRILAVASRCLQSVPATRDEAEHDLVFEGLIELRDPVRPETKEAIRTLQVAGIGVAVITGDQITTARAVAEEVGIPVRHYFAGDEVRRLDERSLVSKLREGAVIARAQPRDKLWIVEALTAAGDVVMVTGDGVNDAPALRVASVGVAMGRAGSDAAREAADIVLTDDNFATLVEAVREGRRLFDNFRKAIRFYLAVKLALILLSAIPAFLGYPLPFTPVQIVILELFMDLGAALAFVSQAADPNVMTRGPRDPGAPFFGSEMVSPIVAGALILALIVLGAFFYGLAHADVEQARTFALVAWFVGHASLGVAMAFEGGLGGLRTLPGNTALIGWLSASLAFAAAIALLPALAGAIGGGPVELPAAAAWALAALLVPCSLMLFSHRVQASMTATNRVG
ncbi:MAG: cation-transporting P-type ATPase [Sphingomonadales bacterium]|nr:cation-transporting P-type ATPase [Sphingomonadales bacterium]